jgi:hypothetical protein
MFLLFHTVAWGAHPLITDDAGTQGKGKFQIEVNGQYDSDKETVNRVSAESTGGQIATTLSYGVIENADLVLSLPYQWGKVKEDGGTVYDENGASDMTLEVKWRFFEKDGLSLALKPGVKIPTGKDPAFLLGGVIYSVTERFDIDFGVKYGLTAAETDWSLMAGTAFRF